MDLTQTLALALSGAVAVPVLQVLKHTLGLKGPVMAWFAYGVSVVIAVVVLLVFGNITLPGLLADPTVLFGAGGVVMATASVVYQSLKDRLKLRK